MWPFNKEFGFWDEWRGHFDGTPVFYSRTLFRARGWKVCLHKMVTADMPECFHSHPAKAWRLILWGGYHEESPWIGNVYNYYLRRPLRLSIVRPEFVHRISNLRRKSSLTLWIRSPITHEAKLIGEGWEKQRNKSARAAK